MRWLESSLLCLLIGGLQAVVWIIGADWLWTIDGLQTKVWIIRADWLWTIPDAALKV